MPNRRIAWAGVILATAAILIATLHVSGASLAPGWSFDLTSGDAALAELIQNLLLFIPLGASLTLLGVRPVRAVAIGAALSFSVEFAQQWIPGRDPSVGDIVVNTVSTALGVTMVVTAPRWLWTPPRRSAQQAFGTAAAAVLAWITTGLLLQPIVPPPPYHDAWTPHFSYWAHYRGQVLAASLGGTRLSQTAIDSMSGRPLTVTVIAASRPPRREAPLIALLDDHDTPLLILFVDGRSLAVLNHTKAVALTLESVDLRWRGALAGVAANDTFVAQTWRDENGVCLALNSARRCGLGYTIGDGWKLIYYPEHFPRWLYVLLNMVWVAGWVVGVGWWTGGTGEASNRKASNETASNEKALNKAAIGAAAAAIVLLGLLIVPMMTGLQATPITEWIGALSGLGLGYVLSRSPRTAFR